MAFKRTVKFTERCTYLNYARNLYEGLPGYYSLITIIADTIAFSKFHTSLIYTPVTALICSSGILFLHAADSEVALSTRFF